MRAGDRRTEIERLLALEGGLAVEELAGRLGVTASTIRRDLGRLTAEGRITRTYGGAVAGARAPEPTLRERAGEARAAKDAIGRWAAAQIGDGETVMLDAGTTVGRVAHHLRGRAGLTVITNGLTSLSELADEQGLQVIVAGGALRQISQGLAGPLAELVVSRLSAERAFLGADGLLADRGICEASTVQTALKELMAARARRVYVLADARKLGRAPFDAWAPLPRPWTLVTDAEAGEDRLAPFRAQPGIEVVTVPAAGVRAGARADRGRG